MKIIEENLDQSEIEILIDNLNDLWYLYNIITPGDIVYSWTKRRIRQDNEFARSDKGEKVRIYVGIEVEKLGFHAFSNRLRITGKIIDGPENIISLHSYHTLNIEVHTKLKIKKTDWPHYILEKINEAIESSKKPNFLVVLIDKGECILAEISNIGVRIIKYFTTSLPGKYYEVNYHKSALRDFFNEAYNILKENTSELINYIVLGGPGFIKEQFFKYIQEQKYSMIKKIVVIPASGANVNSLYEVLKSEKIKTIMENLNLNEELELVNEIFQRIGKDTNTVAYKINDIEKADLYGAIDTLLILDKLFRECSIEERAYFYNLLKNIENKGGKIKIISSLHPAGEQLNKLGGIVALLRFPIN
ncbi:MAG: mRNA surveillance protein pelota [Candidatus Helarchaeota archaeon]